MAAFSTISIKNILLHSLNEKWGDKQFYDFEIIPNSDIEYHKSKVYQYVVGQLVKENLIEKTGGKYIGGIPIGSIYVGKRKYHNLRLRITVKGHEYVVNQKAKEDNNEKNTPNQSIFQNIQNDLAPINKMELKEYIGKGKHKEAIDKIKSILIERKNENIINELIIVESQLTRIEKDKTIGTESREDIDTRLNKVSKGLLTIIDNIE